MRALETDLYQLTMAAGYWAAGKAGEIATFELFVRRLPAAREYLIACGLRQVVDYLLGLRFTDEEIDFLRAQPVFRQAPAGFFDALRAYRFTGELWAMPEGTPVFAGEPILRVRAPMMEAQLPETFLLAMVGFQSNIAAKAARVVAAAAGRPVLEFGTRRAHGPESGLLCGRAAYIGGCAGTSNAEAGRRFGIPIAGTAAHSWVLSFPNETAAFRQLQNLFGERTVHLIDTYDTIEGARAAAALGPPLWGVRLDSGDRLALSKSVRTILDNAGLRDAKIMATGDLEEDQIAELLRAGAPIDSFGVGTHLAALSDAPALGVVYKMVQHEVEGRMRHPAKFSPEKQTLAGAKQVFRQEDADIIGLAEENLPGTPLLELVLRGGAPVRALESETEARSRAARSLESIGRRSRPVRYSEQLEALQRKAGKKRKP